MQRKVLKPPFGIYSTYSPIRTLRELNVVFQVHVFKRNHSQHTAPCHWICAVIFCSQYAWRQQKALGTLLISIYFQSPLLGAHHEAANWRHPLRAVWNRLFSSISPWISEAHRQPPSPEGLDPSGLGLLSDPPSFVCSHLQGISGVLLYLNAWWHCPDTSKVL